MSTFINDEFKMNCVFTTQEGKEIVITGVDEGIVKVDFSFENTPELAARLLVGCFDKVSNFEKVVGKAYNQGQEGWMKGIEISVFDKKLTVTRENASAFNISEFLRKYTDEFWKGFMEKLHNELKNRRKNIEDIIEANESEEIVFESIASKNMWMSWMAWEIEQEGKKGEKTVAVAITFAKYAQFLIRRKNISIYSAFDKSYDDTLLFEEFTEAMLYNAIEILGRWWRYGENLKDWFKKRQERELNKFLNSL